MSGAEKPMSNVRPAASLTAGLLARRGAARPAMRRMPLTGLSPHDALNDDLGWNDLGEDMAGAVATMIDAPAPVPAPEPQPQPVEAREKRTPVLAELGALADRIRDTMFETSRAVRKVRPATLHGARQKVAFTLRLDASRHLRLRLLSAVSQRSAQQLLVAALDELFETNEQVRALAEQIEADRA